MEVNRSGEAFCEAADSHAVVAVSVVVSVLWVLFCFFYHTRLLAVLLSWLINWLSTNTHISIGAVRISLLTGRILFRNVHYATLDYSMWIVDGYISLKWWKGPRNVYHNWQEVQVNLQLNGVQYHWYNRTELYKQLEQKFFEQQQRSRGESVDHISTELEASDSDSGGGHSWLGVTPNISCNMTKVKISLGNDQILDYILVVYLRKGLLSYSYQLSPSHYDQYRYVVRCDGVDVEAFWEPSKCLVDTNSKMEKMICGRSQVASFIYTVDIPGITPNNRESAADIPSPEFFIDISLERSSEIHYGPSINRHRAMLQKLFFPSSYSTAEVTKFPNQGEKRIYAQLVITVTLADGGHLVLPFSNKKNGQVDNLKLMVESGSYIKVIQPWITFSDGYTSIVEGSFYSPSLNSSLVYKPVGKANFVKLRTDLHFPRPWNSLQTWDMQISIDQLNCNILFPYIDFIGDLLDDWNAGPPTELFFFTPVHWQVAVQLCSYEVFLYTNHYNWVDVASISRNENSRLAVCGETGTLNFNFPFTEFLPTEQKISFSAEGQNLVLQRYVPPSSTTKESIFALSQINKHRWRWPSQAHQKGGVYTDKEKFPLGWVHNTAYQDGWVDLACSSNMSIHLTHCSYTHSVQQGSTPRPNVLQVDIEVPNIMLRIFGVLARDLLGLKGNYTGDFPDLTVFDSTDSEPPQVEVAGGKTDKFNSPLESVSTDDFYGTDERFLEIHINFKLPNGTVEFPTHLPRDVEGQRLPLPSAQADMLQIEFAYRQNETRVSIQANVVSFLVPSQGCLNGKTTLGQLTIPSVVFRGHGLNETLCRERVEYAWLMDIDVGCIEGAIATEQVMVVVDWLQASVPHVVSPGDEMEVAPGGVVVEPIVEPLVAVVKYRSFTVSVRQCDVSLLEEKELLRLVVPGFGLAACNLQNNAINWGITFLLHGIQTHLYSSPEHSLSTMAFSNPSLRMTELGQLTVGRIRGQIHTRNPEEYFPSNQLEFLLKADALQRRLYFLWPGVHPVYCVSHSLFDAESVCGCFGGSQFFDSTLEKNKYFLQLQRENMPTPSPKFQHRGSPRRSIIPNMDEPDCLALLSTHFSRGNSIYGHQPGRRVSVQRQRQITVGEDPLSNPGGVKHVHTTLTRLSRRNAEDFIDYSSLLTLNRNSLTSLNEKIVEKVDDDIDAGNITPSSSVESFMSALSQFDDEIEEPSEECNEEPQPQPIVVPAKDLSNAWASTVTFCPYIISTQLATQEASGGSSPPSVTMLCPRYRSHLPSLLPKVSPQITPDEVPAPPVIAKVSVKILLVEKCHVRLTSSVVEALESFIKTAERCLDQRNPTAVVDLLLDRCLSYTSTMIQQNKACIEKMQAQQEQQQQEQQQQPQQQQFQLQSPTLDASTLPTLYFTAEMSTQSHISLQLVSKHNSTQPVTSANMLTVFTTGISCNALVKNHSSACEVNPPAKRGQIEQQMSTSSTINCQALQLQIVTLNITGCHTPTIGSSKLNFVLKLPSHASRSGIEMRGMVEMGLTSAKGTVVGTTKNVVTSNILSSLSSAAKLPRSGDNVPVDVSHVAIMFQLKGAWLQAPTPHKSTIQDLSITCSFANQWQLAVSSCIASVKKMLDTKVHQEKKVLAEVVSNFLQQGGEDIPDMNNKAFSPLNKDSQKLRSSTAYQMCRALPFPKSATTTNTNYPLPNVSIIAIVMGLGCRFFKRKGRKSSARRPQNTHSTDYESCKNIKQLDYESLRLMQHAIIPLLWSCGLKVQGKPINSQAKIEVTVVLNSIAVQILDDKVDCITKTPEVLLKDFSFKCNINNESSTEGTSSLLFDMEKTMQMILDNIEQVHQPRTTRSQMKTCATVNFGAFQVNVSVPLLRYISIMPTVKKSFVYTKPSNTADSFDEADSQCASEELDPLSRALIMALIEKEGNSLPVAQFTPALTGSLRSNVQQPDWEFPKPPTMTSLDGLLHAEEGQALDQSGYSHPYNSNQLRVPHTGASGSESYTPAVSDDTDYYHPLRTPSPDSFDHPTVSDVVNSTHHKAETSNNTNNVFLLINIGEVKLSAEVFPFKVLLALESFTGSVNVKFDQHQQKSKGLIPSCTSVSGTLNEATLKLSNIDVGGELVSFTMTPINTIFVLNCRRSAVMEYKAVVQSGLSRLEVKQSPIVIHRQFQKHFQKLQKLYQELFPPSDKVVQRKNSLLNAPLPAQLPVGSVQVVIKNISAVITPLPSLTVSYKVPSVMVLLETTSDVRFSLDLTDSVLRFSPKMPKDELALGKIPVPSIYIGGTLLPSTTTVPDPSLDLELMIKEVNIDLTTDVLNQLLVVQIAFIKELNELVQTLINIRESITGTKPDDDLFLETNNGSKDLLRSFQFTLHGTTVTVTTPSSTAAVRFSTTKIDALVKKSNKIPRSIMALSGRVEVDLTLALGYLMRSSSDSDDFKELILFETKISVKNSSRSVASADAVDGLSPDSFHITIQSPHLNLQPPGIEKALIFWVHCESAYTHWLEERKAVTDEVQKATTQLMDNISTVEPANASTLNFQQPKLVQISVNDAGACISLVPMANATSPQKDDNQIKQNRFPALVLGVKEMRISVNLSHRVVSKGYFNNFGLRFTESFNPRQRVWATLTKKKMINQASVPKGTYSLCMDTKRATGFPPQEKIICFFEFLMSGLVLHANSMMGRHVSLLMKAFVSLKSEQTGHMQATRSYSGFEKERKAPRSLRKKGLSTSALSSVEHNLAKQSQLVNKLRQFGPSEKLQSEVDQLRRLEASAAEQWKKQRRKNNPQISFGNITRIFSPFTKPTLSKVGYRRTESLLIPSSQTNESLERVSSDIPNLSTSPSLELKPPFKKGHRRAKSDIHDIASAVAMSGESDESRPSSRPASQLSTHDEEIEDDRLSLTSTPSRTPSPTTTPVFEISVTVEVESGKMYFCHQLYEGDSTQDVKQKPYYSPMLGGRSSKINPSASAIFPRKLLTSRSPVARDLDVTIFIPAVQFHAHYYSSLVSELRVSTSESRMSRAKSVNFRFPPSPVLPSKKGSLLMSFNIDSLPAEMKLQPSLLEFMEQVMKPLKGNADSGVSNDSDSAQSDSESGTGLPQPLDTPTTLSYPIEVTIFFHVKPSMVTLSCQPYSRVECNIAVPDVNLCCSFVLCSPQLVENSASRLPSSSSSSLSGNVRFFNNLCVSGAVQAFSFNIFNPNISSTARADNTTETKKEVIGLRLGLASVHISRRAVKVMSPLTKDSYEKMKISVVVDVASIVLGFDMRRLNDVTAFRKCWYRKSVVESFMLGSNNKKTASKTSSSLKKTTISEEKETIQPQQEDQQQLTHAEIVCVANIDDLSCTANVSTVMGNATIVLNQFTIEACAEVKSSEMVYLNLECVLYSAQMDARSGVIAGDLYLKDTQFEAVTSSERGTIPTHTCNARMELLKARVDFMMSSVMAGTAKDISVHLHDSWYNVLSQKSRSSQSNESIKIICNMGWDQAKLVICRSTTASLEQIVKRLKEFVLQQKRRSERTFLLMWPETSPATPTTMDIVDEVDTKSEAKIPEEPGYHHWYWATKASCSSLLEALGFTIAEDGNKHTVSFTGTIEITGNSVCLACLHGPTFRETEWAIFSLCDITASFSTQAIPSFIQSAHSHKVGWGLDNRRICRQTTLLTLGNNTAEKSSQFGSVFRVVNKGTMPPLTNQPLAEWVSFVCIDHHIHPNLPQTKLFKYTRKVNVSGVFGIPALKLEMVHDHFYPSNSASLEADQTLANVVCSFLTTFHSSIAITTAADHYFFLHNLVKAYVDSYTKSQKDSVITAAKVKGIEEPMFKTKRHFSTEEWQLDPHLVLLAGNSWTSGTVNIGWLLEMLGFQEAKTTIPKSIQNGVMDLLDETLSLMVKRLLSISAKKKLE